MSKIHIDQHPCFNVDAHFKYGRIHLPVAPACNIACRYCNRKYDCPNESRPGVVSQLLSPEEALEKLDRVMESTDRIKVVGIAGPGEPLFNEASFESFRLVDEKYPELFKCISSNGLLVEDRMDSLLEVGIDSLTVTVNALTEEIAEKIYRPMTHEGRKISHGEFIDKQWRGIKRAQEEGIKIKINTVFIQGVNDGEILDIARRARDYGVYKMNIMPLIPEGDFKDFPRPSVDSLNDMRERAEEYIDQIFHCKQCRADACGIPGLE